METKLQVTGMTCMHCVGAVTKALQRVPGVEKVQVSLEEKQAVVAGNASPEALIAAVKDEGYAAAVK